MKTKQILFGILIIVLFLLPWFNTDLQNEFSVPKVSQEDVTFFEINPCKISLVQFITSNVESIYQNHFYFRANDKSSIKCFGRVSGVTVIQGEELQTQFFISVGTNPLINLVLQGLFWILILSLIPKSKVSLKNYKFKNISIFLISYFFAYSIYAESRYYEASLYEFNFRSLSSYFLIFLVFLLISKNLIDSYQLRSENIINFLPFIYLFTFIFSGFNYSLLGAIFVYLGLVSFLNGESKSKFNFVYISLSIWWLINSNGSYYFKVGKLRGFTSSIYEFNANLLWIIFIYFLLLGIYKYYIDNRKRFKLEIFTKNLSLSAMMMMIAGIMSSNSPIINFYNYYFLGLQRYGEEKNTPFAFSEDVYELKISWRGIFPSSETVGEFYGLVLLILLFWIIKRNEIRTIDYLGIISASLGLYFSDNRTAIVLVFVFSLIYVYLIFFKNLLNTKFVFILIALFSTGLLVFLLNDSSYKFISNSIISQSSVFQYDSIYSSYLRLLNSGQETGTLFSSIFSFFSMIAFFLNRSEMWGLFFARYNPTFMELLFGSGPMNFGQLYGEVVINNPESFLLPHSSILSLILFIGIIPFFLLVLMFLYILILNKNNYEFVLISTYIFTNILKNDSINYLVAFIFYSFLYLFFKNKRNKSIFR